MAVIEIEIDDAVVEELQQSIANQAAGLAMQFRGEVPAGVPLTVEAWLQNVIEQSIAQVLSSVSRRAAVENARTAVQDATAALVKAVAGVRSVVVQK